MTGANSQAQISGDEATTQAAGEHASGGSTTSRWPPAQTDSVAAEDANDTGFNDEMIRIMTAAAELRAERARIRSGEDERLAEAEAAAMKNLIQTHARCEARSLAGDQPGSE